MESRVAGNQNERRLGIAQVNDNFVRPGGDGSDDLMSNCTRPHFIDEF